MKKNLYLIKTNLIVREINTILSNISPKQTKILINEILTAKRIFLVAVGRVNLALQSFGKRLSHFGFKVELVGSLTEKPATKKDLLIVASGSGESIVPLNIAKKAKKIGCKILHITSAKKSSIRKLSNYVVELNAPTKKIKKNNKENLFDSASKTKASIQPMSTLFDQALHIYGDIVCVLLIEKLKLKNKDLWKKHPNLE